MVACNFLNQYCHLSKTFKGAPCAQAIENTNSSGGDDDDDSHKAAPKLTPAQTSQKAACACESADQCKVAGVTTEIARESARSQKELGVSSSFFQHQNCSWTFGSSGQGSCACKCDRFPTCCHQMYKELSNMPLFGNLMRNIPTKQDCCTKCSMNVNCGSWTWRSDKMCTLYVGPPQYMQSTHIKLSVASGPAYGQKCF
jgi:hypothetical protein